MYLSAHQEEWQEKFLHEQAILQKVFQPLPCDFHHIGSTSLKGACAKPIIDILGVTPDITAIDPYNPQLEKLGYSSKGELGMRQRRFFKKEGVNLHIFEDSDPETARHLRFVAYLKAHPRLRDDYSALKKQLAGQYPNDPESYILGKQEWIKMIDLQAATEKTAPWFYPTLGPRKLEWSVAEIVQAMHTNHHLFLTYFAKFHPRIHLVFQPDVTVVMAEVANDAFNTISGAHFSEANARKRIQQINKFFQQQHLPFAWWVSERDDTPKNLTQFLEECGLFKREEETGMYLELSNFHPHAPKELFRRVDNESTLNDFAEISSSFSGHDNVYEQLLRDLPPICYLEGAPLEMYVLYKDGAAVTIGMALFHANVMGIYYVATRPEYRKMGLGTEMMHYLLARGKTKGYHVATLQASDQGKNLYRRLGFIEACWMREYKL